MELLLFALLIGGALWQNSKDEQADKLKNKLKDEGYLHKDRD